MYPISFWGLCFILEMEFDLDKALEEVPIHIEDPPFPCGRQEKRSSGFISELPSEEGKKLEHFTKLRPKRNKKQQPTQAAVGGLGAPSLPHPFGREATDLLERPAPCGLAADGARWHLPAGWSSQTSPCGAH